VTDHDFDALRARRNDAVRATVEAVAVKWGVPADFLLCSHDDAACYCACPAGPCEHDWTGPEREILDDRDRPCGFERTCARCGAGVMAHDVRTAEF
jgi:hypothetical protein